MKKISFNKKLIKHVFDITSIAYFLFAICQHVSLTDKFKINLSLGYFGVLLVILFTISIAIFLISQLAKIIKIITQCQVIGEMPYWYIVRQNCKVLGRIMPLIIVLAAVYLSYFFGVTGFDVNFAWHLVIVVWASFALALSLVSIFVYVAVVYVIKKNYVQFLEKEVTYCFGLISVEIGDQQRILEEKITFNESMQAIKIINFISRVNKEIQIKINWKVSEILNNDKKAKTPPRIVATTID